LLFKLKHDETESIGAIIYQFYVAVEKCFDWVVGEKVYIENYADIAVSDKEPIKRIACFSFLKIKR